MKKGLTEIIYILDKSGSMSELKNDTISGFNGFLENQQQSNIGQANMTIIFFDSSYEVYADHIDINKIEPLTDKTYIPCGGTAFYDALGLTIDNVGLRLSQTPEEERPENVLVLIMSDGEENSSRTFTGNAVAAKVEHQKTKYNWEFVFMGCNQDSLKSAQAVDIGNYSNVNFSSRGINNMYSVMDCASTSYRKSGTVGDIPENID